MRKSLLSLSLLFLNSCVNIPIDATFQQVPQCVLLGKVTTVKGKIQNFHHMNPITFQESVRNYKNISISNNYRTTTTHREGANKLSVGATRTLKGDLNADLHIHDVLVSSSSFSFCGSTTDTVSILLQGSILHNKMKGPKNV